MAKRKDMTDSDWSKFKNFRKEEFKCKCVAKGLHYCNGYHTGIAYSLVEFMQKVRDHYGKSITISSGLRCSKYNAKIGGSKYSNHMQGLACDFRFSGMNKNEVLKYLKTLPNYQYAYTNSTNMANAIHITVKPTYEQEEVKYEQLTSNVWARNGGYGFKYSKWGIIPKNTKLKIIARNVGSSNGYKWDKIEYNGKTLYIPNKWSKYL